LSVQDEINNIKLKKEEKTINDKPLKVQHFSNNLLLNTAVNLRNNQIIEDEYEDDKISN
jgi:hypothetical protein